MGDRDGSCAKEKSGYAITAPSENDFHVLVASFILTML